MMHKMAELAVPDNIYNWIKDFFTEHFHCTRYAGEYSSVAEVKASVIQGSGLGPASYLVTTRAVFVKFQQGGRLSARPEGI